MEFLASDGKVLRADDYSGMPLRDKKTWGNLRNFYESISRMKRIFLIGKVLFYVYDYFFQKIFNFYPKKDLSRSNFQTKLIYNSIKNGWGKDLIERLKKKPLPLITTFLIPAFMADYFNYPNEIYCIICDADISRSWAPLNPKTSKIKYLVPNERTLERLILYGVKKENIFLTGYPLPFYNNTNENLKILKEDLKIRLLNLDPNKNYLKKYESLIKDSLGFLPKESNRPLTLLFSVGGAGAQKEIGLKILKNLSDKIRLGSVKLILAAGVKTEVKFYFEEEVKKLKLEKEVDILSGKDIEEYFSKFNILLRKVDILWTKPSELSFYSALGIPIIIAPTIGSHEEFNKKWLLESGYGIEQEDPGNTREWLFDFIKKGSLAECALQGFIEGEKNGVLNIKKIVEQ